MTRALSSALIRRAGLRRGDGAETGIITFIQRAGSALNLNVHFHILVPDGAYTFEHDKPHFHRAPPPSSTALRQLLDTLIVCITRALVHGGALIEEPEHPYLDLELNSPLEQHRGAALRYRIAVGPARRANRSPPPEKASRSTAPLPAMHTIEVNSSA